MSTPDPFQGDTNLKIEFDSKAELAEFWNRFAELRSKFWKIIMKYHDHDSTQTI